MSTIAYWKIRARLLRVPGVANVAIWGERLQQLQVQVDPERMRAHDVSLDEVMDAPPRTRSTRGCCGYSDGRGDRHRRVRRHRQSAARHPARPADRHAARTWPRCRSRQGRRPRAPRRRRGWSSRTTSRSLATPSINDGPGPPAHRREVAVGQHARGHPAASRRRSSELQPGLPGIESTRTSSGRPTSSTSRSRTSRSAAARAACSWSLVLVAFLFEWRTALISVVAIPLSLIAAGAGAVPARRDDQHDDPGGVRDRASGVVVDDAIIDVENILRRLRQRGDGSEQARRRASSSRRRSRCAARSSTRR